MVALYVTAFGFQGYALVPVGGVHFSVLHSSPLLGVCVDPSGLTPLGHSGHFHSCVFSQDVAVHVPV